MRKVLLGVALLLSCQDSQGGGLPDWSSVSSWVYQLQPSPSQSRAQFISDLASSCFEVVVIDYSFTGGPSGEFTPDEIAQLKSAGKTVLAYVSIGEAEDYRWYWDPAWENDPPEWLGPENPEWEGNYPVKFWYPQWVEIVMSYLRKVENQGFDGFYLDRIDVYETLSDSFPFARDSMIAFVKRIKERFPDMLVVPQNADELLQEPDYLDAVDAQACEDVYYIDDDPVDPSETAWRVTNMRLALDAGKPVFVVDYPTEPDKIADFYSRARADGFIPYRTVRDLDSLVVNPQDCGG